MVAEVLRAAREQPDYPRVLFFFLATPAQGEEFFASHGPGARGVADPDGSFYRAFGLARGGAAQVVGPGVWVAGLRSLFKGHRPGRPVGDPMQMPGIFLVESGKVRWRHAFRHAGDHPDFATLGARAS